MSKKCPWCKVNVYLTELKHWYKCPECQTEFPERAFPKEITLFDRITASPEVLAPHFVYQKWSKLKGCWDWYSTIIKDNAIPFRDKSEAIAATVARLKEVEK